MRVVRLGVSFLFVGATIAAYGAAAAPDGPEHHAGHDTAAPEDAAASGHDHTDHSGHDHGPPATSSNYEISSAAYQIPAVNLTDQYGRAIRLDRLLAEDRPTLVQFIFTSCTTICPVMGAVFGGAQTDIAALAPDYRMVSISIDPEYDTPERLREFAAKQNANPEWVLLTGSKEAVMQATKAFDALYQGDNKMYHQPYTFIRWRTSDDWVRIRGLMSITDLVKEFSDARKEGI